MRVMKNKCECQKGLSSRLRGSDTEQPHDAKVVWTLGTNRFVLEQCRDVQECGDYKGTGGKWAKLRVLQMKST